MQSLGKLIAKKPVEKSVQVSNRSLSRCDSLVTHTLLHYVYVHFAENNKKRIRAMRLQYLVSIISPAVIHIRLLKYIVDEEVERDQVFFLYFLWAAFPQGCMISTPVPRGNGVVKLFFSSPSTRPAIPIL